MFLFLFFSLISPVQAREKAEVDKFKNALDKNEVRVEQRGTDYLYKTPGDNQTTIAAAIARSKAAPTGSFKDGVITINGEIGDHTLDWLVANLSRMPKKNDCKLKLEGKAKENFLKESADFSDVADLTPYVADVETLANQFCRVGITKLVMNSSGGQMLAAKKIGAAVWLAGLDTEVPKEGVCGSACNDIFRRGRTRTAAPDSVFIFHLPEVAKLKIKRITQSRMMLPPSLLVRVREKQTVYVTGELIDKFGMVNYVSNEDGTPHVLLDPVENHQESKPATPDEDSPSSSP